MDRMSWPQRVFWTLAWTLAVLVLLFLVASVYLVGSVYVDGFGSADRLADVTNTWIPGSEIAIPAYVAVPDTPGRHPVVIMLHEFWGLNPDVVSRAELLARERGYVVIAPNLFRGQVTHYTPRGVYQVLSTPQAQINRDLDDVVAWARSRADADPGRIGMVGFCFGGRSALLYSLHNPGLQATVDYYGLPLDDERRLSAMHEPFLGIYGGADTALTEGEVQRFRATLQRAGADASLSVYDGQQHAFMHGADEIQGPGPQAIAWREMGTFLEQRFSEASRSESSSADAPQPADDYYGLVPAIRLAIAHTGHGHPWQH